MVASRKRSMFGSSFAWKTKGIVAQGSRMWAACTEGALAHRRPPVAADRGQVDLAQPRALRAVENVLLDDLMAVEQGELDRRLRRPCSRIFAISPNPHSFALCCEPSAPLQRGSRAETEEAKDSLRPNTTASLTRQGARSCSLSCRASSRRTAPRLRGSARGHQTPRRAGATAGGPRCELGDGAPLLGHRPGHPRTAGARRLGRQGHRSARRRPARGVPGDEGSLTSQPQVHARLRVGVARSGNCATGRCTITVAPEHRIARAS